MKKILITIFILLTLFIHSKEIIYGIVTKVSDGDTITIIDEDMVSHKIRFAYIDAPEKKQEGGKESKEYLEKLIMNKEVKVVAKTIDRYSRIIGEVFYKEEMVNKLVVRDGYAFVYTKFFKKSEKILMLELLSYETIAKNSKKGIFIYECKETPEEFRKKK